MKRRYLKRSLSMALALAMTAGIASTGITQAADTMPWTGDKAIGKNQPHVVGQRIYDLKYWEQDSEDNAELLRAQVPLQQRNEVFAATQANPDLKTEAEIFNMQGDYGNSFFEATTYNNAFAPYLFNYWQYTDYYASWHGVTTKGVPINLYDPEGYWGDRAFEFGLINMPNPAYTNAAHKNGSKSIGCIFLPRTGQTHHSMIEKDENGEFPVAKKLIEFANYYGFDGYFINQEESIPGADVPVYKEFTKYLIDNGIYIQWYDSITPSGSLSYQNRLNASNSTFIHDDKYGLGKVNSSLFVNYDWFRSNYIQTSFEHAEERGINTFTEVFFGVEANQGKLSGSHGSALNVDKLYEPGTKNLRGSVALFTPSDWLQRGLEGDIGVKGAENNSGYYWMIAERERMYYSGVAQDPTKTGKMSGYADPSIGVNNNSGWVGVADFASERSVINGSTFYSNFNTGHGMQYYQDGAVVNDNEWANMNIQDILPTWQWWIDTAGTKLNVDFDYGEKFQKLDKSGNDIGTGYTKIGGYNGGSSLVVNGNLDEENYLHLYKTDLSVNENTKASVTFNKISATDSSAMELGVIFKSAPDTVVTFNIPGANQQTDGWVTKSVSLGDYAGEEIASMGLCFKDGSTAIENYQMNIGEMKVTDGSVSKADAPTGFHIENAYDSTGEMVVKWDMADYDQVKQYNLYANLSDGSRVYLGGTYDSTYYIKSLYGEKDIVTLELTAVNGEGVESAPATTAYKYADKVSDIKVSEADTENNNERQNSNVGYLDVSWENPTVDYEGIEITVTPAKYYNYEARDLSFTTTVAKGVSSARVEARIGDGSAYKLAMRLVYADGSKGEAIEYTGNFKDVTSQPFEAGVTANGKSVTFNIPKNEDWWHMYATVNGKSLFNPYAIRGKTSLSNISVPSDSGIIEVVLEDYSGNMSKKALIPYGQSGLVSDPDEAMFPDPVLLEAVKTQIGDTKEAINSFDGTLDLSNLEIQDYTGLELIQADTINLTGSNLKEVIKGTFNSKVGKVILKDSASLEYIYYDAFNGSSTSSVDISGCSALKVLGLNDSELETIEYGDTSVFTNMISVNLTGSRFDLSEGTQEKAFADAMAELTEGKEDIVTTDPAKSSLSVGADVVSSQNLRNPQNLFDGEESGYNYSTTSALPANVVVDLGSQQTIEGYSIISYYSGSYGPKDFTISYSNDNVNWTELSAVTGNDQQRLIQDVTPVTARYFKLNITASNYSWCYMMEWALMGHKTITYSAGVQSDNQRPNAYPAAPEAVVRVDQTKGLTLNLSENLNSFTTIRGNDFASMKDASFIDPDYDLDAAAQNDDLHEIHIKDANGNVSYDTIDASRQGAYTVEYVTYNDPSPTGRVMYEQKIYVRGITTVLEEIIAKAEQLEADGALENTMEAVVTEYHAALNNAKEIVAKDGATQEEINAATVRLLSVMAKVDWKQGDKTALQVVVDIANTIKPDLDLYVEAGKQEFLNALAKAEALLISGNAWEDDIQDATAELIEATANLRMAANKDILNDMINKANTIDLSAYTEESANAVRTALAAAEALAAEETGDQDAVNAAADTLQAALDGLTFKSGDTNTPADDNPASNGGAATVGDGSAPTKTGDSFQAAGIATLALVSALGAVWMLKKKER